MVNENCPQGEVITTEEDCKKACKFLDIEYQLKLSSNNKIAGCYSHSNKAWFNENTDILSTKPSKGGIPSIGLCVKGINRIERSFIDVSNCLRYYWCIIFIILTHLFNLVKILHIPSSKAKHAKEHLILIPHFLKRNKSV